MKRLLLASIALCAGVGASARLNHHIQQLRVLGHQAEFDYATANNAIGQLTDEVAALKGEIHDAKARFRQSSPAATVESDLLAWFQSGQQSHWPQSTLPELRQWLGVGWNSSPDYVLVSKACLKRISLNAVGSQGIIDPTVCDVLAITPDERTTLESLIRRTETEYLAWMKTNVKRIEPSGDIVAQYVIPANPELAKRLIFAGGIGVLGAIGLERTELARNYASQWVEKRGYLGQMPVSLTVRRQVEPDGQRLEAKCDTVLPGGASSTGYADLTPTSFPEVFRAVFPGGWPELARRENFELASDFEAATPVQ